MKNVKTFDRFINEEIDRRAGNYQVLLKNLSSAENGYKTAKTPEAKQEYLKTIQQIRQEIKEIEQAGLNK